MGEYSKENIGSGSLSPFDSLSCEEIDPATQLIQPDTQSTIHTGEGLGEQVTSMQFLSLYFKLISHNSSTRASSPADSNPSFS